MSGTPNLNEFLRNIASTVWSAWHESHAQAEPHLLWHYTTMRGLHGILDAGEMWFSDAAFLDDMTEMSWAVSLFEEVIVERLSAGLRSPEGTQFFERARGGIQSDLANRETYGTINPAFVACFCVDGDSLHLWRAYTGNGRGYSIGLFPDFIRGRLKPIRLTAYQFDRVYVPVLRRVIYAREEQKDHLNNLISAFDTAIAGYVSSGGTLATPHVFSQNFYRMFYEYLCSFKHPTFSEEHEWRFIYLPDFSRIISEDEQRTMAETKLKYRESYGYLVPYITADIETDPNDGTKRLPFEDIVVGPGLDPRLGRRSINAYLLRKEFYLGSLINIQESTVPLRVL